MQETSTTRISNETLQGVVISRVATWAFSNYIGKLSIFIISFIGAFLSGYIVSAATVVPRVDTYTGRVEALEEIVPDLMTKQQFEEFKKNDDKYWDRLFEAMKIAKP